jgi:serine/threonine protein phosphatase PrpC
MYVWHDSMEEAILQGFARTEAEVLALNETRNDISGACAVTVVHHGDRLYVANLGDSRALIGRKKVKGSFISRLTLTKASRVEDIESREKQKRVNLR